MPNPAFENEPTGPARALVEHLRRNPDEVRDDPAVLAARFGLETEFVRRALARVPEASRPEPRGPSRIAQRAGRFAAWAVAALDVAAESPLRFEAISLLAALAISVALGLLLGGVPFGGGTLAVGAIGAVILAVVALQMGVFYRRRMVRYAAYGGLVFGVGTALPLMVVIWVRLQTGPRPPSGATPDVTQGFVVFAVGLTTLLVGGGLYAAVGALASLAGGWAEIRREEREWEGLSRQELLERYFELQKRLDGSDAAPTPPLQGWESLPVVAWVRSRPFLAAGLLGLVSGVVHVLVSAAFSGAASRDTLGILLLAKGACSFAAFVAIAFLAGRASRGAWCGPPFRLCFTLATFIPAGGFGLSRSVLALQLLSATVGTAVYALAGAVAGLGATIQGRAAQATRRQRNDGATLVAEMLEIQWRLEEDATRVTVLVVDAAKSTTMKVGADPLDVEYSFREYQTWIAETCGPFGGRVHSIAGDGAVVAFSDGASAVAAARRLQTDVARFNASLNRLPKPFRLRLGLHAGQVAGDLDDVQFTEVIDIAAHVESIAPVGGIAATAAVVTALGEAGFLPLARDVDGQVVYIALVPTEG